MSRLMGVVFAFAALALSGCEMEAADAQMEVLCRHDGGVKIYEKVFLPAGQFNEYGDLKFFKTWNTSGGGYKFVSDSEQIKITRPALDMLTWNHAKVTKATFMIFREEDNRLLASYVTYWRTGGAIIPRLGPDPFNGCPGNINDKKFLNMVFVTTN